MCPGSVECVLEGLNVSVKCSICLGIDEVFELINSHWIYIEFTLKNIQLEVLNVPVKCFICLGSGEYVWEVFVTC